jgi:hypothetical protein
MAEYNFDDDEKRLMREILEGYVHELTSEIFRTDTPAFREDLKRKRSVVRDILGRLSEKAA